MPFFGGPRRFTDIGRARAAENGDHTQRYAPSSLRARDYRFLAVNQSKCYISRMGKIERAIKALEALPPEHSEEVADIVLELTDAIKASASGSVLTAQQREEMRQRRASGFRAADPLAIDRLIESMK